MNPIHCHTVDDLPMAEYHGDQDAFGSSQLKYMLQSPAHFYEHVIAARDRPAKDATPAVQAKMDFGSLVHAVLSDKVNEEFVIYDGDGLNDMQPKDRNKYIDGYKAIAGPNRRISTEDVLEKACLAAESARQHPAIKPVLDSAIYEQSIFYTIGTSAFYDTPEGKAFASTTGCPPSLPGEDLCVNLKARPDLLALGGSAAGILDWKTTEDASLYPFASVARRLNYYFSAAMYQHACELAYNTRFQFAWVAIEREPPFGVQVYKADREELIKVKSQYIQCVQKLGLCLHTNSWPSYEATVKTLPNLATIN